MDNLYEQWIASGEDWMKSTLVIATTRSMHTRRRGRYVMKTFKALKDQHGVAAAKTLRDSKKEQESSKSANDGNCYWMESPDFPGVQDHVVFESIYIEYIYIYIYVQVFLKCCVLQCHTPQDQELIRVFESLEFEEGAEEGFRMSHEAHGALNEHQTRQLAYLS